MKQKHELVLYPKVEYPTKSFKGAKKVTVPSQSMSLAEILRRFTRKESLPVEKEGVYDTRFGDLEKLKNADIVEQTEKVQQIRKVVKRHNEIKKEKEEEEKRKAAAPPPPPVVPPDNPTK